MPTASTRKLRFNPTRRGWMLLAVGGLVLSSLIADVVTSAGRVRAGVSVAGLELGGRRFDEAERILTARARSLAAEPVVLTAGDEELTLEPATVSFFPDVEETLERARRAGRQGHPLARLWQATRSYFASNDIGWVSEVDRGAARKLVEEWAERFDDREHEAGIQATEDGTIVPVEPRAGRSLDTEASTRTIVRAMQSWPRRPLELPFVTRRPRTDLADAQAAAARANELVAEPVTLLSPTGGAELTPLDLSKLVEAVPRRQGGNWSLEVRFSSELLTEHIGPRMKDLERPARNARFAVSGSGVSVVESEDGLEFDAEKTAEALDAAVALTPPRSTDVAFTVQTPSLTTEAAKALNIREMVSTFTTQHPAGQPRVKNIHLIAGKVDGIILRPGEAFSLNRRAGERTAAQGYVLAPMIYDGEFRDEIGGGVSQFATTMFNAVFFGGYKFETYKAHSYYISRYPAGREATVSFPAPDLRWTNNSSSGVLVKTSYSSASITVTLYGDKGGKRVESRSDERTNVKPPPEKRVADPSMPPGTEKVTQRGAEGFDIVVWRLITKDGNTTRQRFFTRYQPQPTIISFGPGEPEPTPEPTEPPSEPPAKPTPPPPATAPPATPPPATPHASPQPTRTPGAAL